MNKDQHIRSFAFEPSHERGRFDPVHIVHRQGTPRAQSMFTPAKISGRMGMSTTRFLVTANDQPRTHVAEFIDTIEHLDSVVIEMTRDAMQRSPNTESHRDNRIVIQLRRKFLFEVRTPKA